MSEASGDASVSEQDSRAVSGLLRVMLRNRGVPHVARHRGVPHVARWLVVWACLAAPAAWAQAEVETEAEAKAETTLDLEQRPEAVESEVRLAGMTYVSSRGELNDMVLDAESARILPEREIAHLEGVRVRLVSATGGDGGLDMTCDTGLFEFDTGDFLAVGNVDGTTGDGRQFRTTRVRYKHEGALVTTDEPVEIRDETGTYRGGGFRYFLEENRFRMLGGASVIQE